MQAPRIAEAPVHLECRFVNSIEIPGWNPGDVYKVIFGEVVGIHIDDDIITDAGLIDVARMMPIARLGYNDYTRVDADSIFTLVRPK